MMEQTIIKDSIKVGFPCPSPGALPLPIPSQLDKWTRLDVFRYFKSKAVVLSIPDVELNIFIEERITGKHLIEITIEILKLAGFTIGSSMNIFAEIKRLKNAFYIYIANNKYDAEISRINDNMKDISLHFAVRPDNYD